MNSLYTFLWTSLRLALRQLIRHKVRSFLTMLGILIGVGSVVAIVSLGEGLREMFMGQIASQANTDMIWVMPDAPLVQGQVPRGIKLFKQRDVDMVSGSEYIGEVYGFHMDDSALVKHGWRSDRVQCLMVTEEYFPMDGWKLNRGRLFNDAEDRGGRWSASPVVRCKSSSMSLVRKFLDRIYKSTASVSGLSANYWNAAR